MVSRRLALITGASRGIGSAAAAALAAQNCDVILHCRSDSSAARVTEAACRELGATVVTVHCDFSTEDPEALVEHLVAAGRPLDVLVNNAAVLIESAPLDVTERDFSRVWRVNVWAPYVLLAQAHTYMRRGGRIVNVTSDATHFPRPQIAAYAASKSALESLTRSFAQALGHMQISVNAVAPGPTRTDMLVSAAGTAEALDAFAAMSYAGRLAEPGDIASVIRFLASPEAAWVTGQVLEVSGGRTA